MAPKVPRGGGGIEVLLPLSSGLLPHKSAGRCGGIEVLLPLPSGED